MEDQPLVSCGAEPGLVCPFVGDYLIEPAPKVVFSTMPAGNHPAVPIPCREQEEETHLYLNVFSGRQVLFIDDKSHGPFLFLYEDASGKPIAICTRQTPIPDVLGISGGRWRLVQNVLTETANTEDADTTGKE